MTSDTLIHTTQEIFNKVKDRLNIGHGPEYLQTVARLPQVELKRWFDDKGTIHLQTNAEPSEKKMIHKALWDLRPWRKGPFQIDEIHIDTEWRSDFKWDRFKEYLPNLDNQTILDIGASSGYFMFQLLKRNPRFILGVDTSTLFYAQFLALNHFIQSNNLHYLPCTFEELSPFENSFDVILCMGILYHRKAPLETLEYLRKRLAAKGTLILEGLYIEGKGHYAHVPEDRYFKMNNVHFLPTLDLVHTWLKRAGYLNIEIIDTCLTTNEEQHQTPWIKGESFEDFIDPHDSSKTIEGLPAPRRFIAKALNKSIVK